MLKAVELVEDKKNSTDFFYPKSCQVYSSSYKLVILFVVIAFIYLPFMRNLTKTYLPWARCGFILFRFSYRWLVWAPTHLISENGKLLTQKECTWTALHQSPELSFNFTLEIPEATTNIRKSACLRR